MGACDLGTSAELRNQLTCAVTFGERTHSHQCTAPVPRVHF